MHAQSSLRIPFQENVLNVRPANLDETYQMVGYLASKRGLSRISVVYQNDSLGINAVAVLRRAMRAKGLQFESESSIDNMLQIQMWMPRWILSMPSLCNLKRSLLCVHLLRFRLSVWNPNMVFSISLNAANLVSASFCMLYHNSAPAFFAALTPSGFSLFIVDCTSHRNQHYWILSSELHQGFECCFYVWLHFESYRISPRPSSPKRILE
jgi:hypothetical protein